MDVFYELMGKLGPGTYVMLDENYKYVLNVPKRKMHGEYDTFYNEDTIVALEEAVEARKSTDVSDDGLRTIMYDEPWQIHPDSETPINDLPDDGKPIEDKPF